MMNRGRGRGRGMGGGQGRNSTPSTKLHVTSLPHDCSEDELKVIFETFGQVTEVAMVRDFAFVHYTNTDDASRAVENLDGFPFNGSSLSVKFSTSGGKGGSSDAKGGRFSARPTPYDRPFRGDPYMQSGGSFNDSYGSGGRGGRGGRGGGRGGGGGGRERNPTKLHVTALPEGCSTKDLESLFESCGKIAECDIVRDFAFVHFCSSSDADDAVKKFDGYEWNGSTLSVKHSTSGLRQKPGAGSGDCFKCGGRGHTSNNCPSDGGGGGRGFPSRGAPFQGRMERGGRGGGRGGDRQINPTKLHVTHLPDGCSKQDIEKLFETYGKVAECAIVRDFAFVHFLNADDAKKAVDGLNGYSWNGSTLGVCHSTSALRQKPGNTGDCFFCGGRGHMSSLCPSAPENRAAGGPGPGYGGRFPDMYPEPLAPRGYSDPFRADPFRADSYRADPYRADRFSMDPYDRIERDPQYRRALLERLLRETDQYSDPYARPPPEFYEKKRGMGGRMGAAAGDGGAADSLRFPEEHQRGIRPLDSIPVPDRFDAAAGNGYAGYTSFADPTERSQYMRGLRDDVGAGYFA